MYLKDGFWQKGREIVNRPFTTALEAVEHFLDKGERAKAWRSKNIGPYEFGRQEVVVQDRIERADLRPPVGMPEGSLFFMRCEDMDLSVRSANCLSNDGIVHVGELIQKSEAEMLRTPNFGRKSLNEIKEVLAQLELSLRYADLGLAAG